VFVVRHNPAGPSNSLHSNGLPSPATHHPKPRRLVGKIDGPSLTDSDVNDHETNGSTAQGYETALEIQSESESAGTISGGGHEEPAMQELVASEASASKPISGVEAWELDLGETEANWEGYGRP
jgi:hypothetical protein